MLDLSVIDVVINSKFSLLCLTFSLPGMGKILHCYVLAIPLVNRKTKKTPSHVQLYLLTFSFLGANHLETIPTRTFVNFTDASLGGNLEHIM